MSKPARPAPTVIPREKAGRARTAHQKEPAETAQGLPILAFEGPAAFEAWLAREPRASPGVWLKIAKKDGGTATVTYAQAVEAALCHGWIDGQKAPFDAAFWLQKFTPRGPRSKWSQLNRDKALTLVAAKRMTAAGQAEIDAARRDGRWDKAYAPQSQASVPEDLQAELDKNPAAAACFAGLDRLNRYAVLYRLQSVKKPETRLRKLGLFVEMLNRNETIYPRRRG